MTLQDLRKNWNAQSDGFNQWDSLCLEEMLQFAQHVEREEIIEEIPGGCIVDPQWVCDMIRGRGNKA